VTLTTSHLASRLKPGVLGYLLSDTTYKISFEGITLFINATTDAWGRCHICTATFTTRETKEALGAAWRDIDAALLRWWKVRLTPKGLVSDNDDASFAASSHASFGPDHWEGLIRDGLLLRVNCAVHMDLGLSGSKGRVKFARKGHDALHNKKKELKKWKKPELKQELLGLGLSTTGSKEDLLKRLLAHFSVVLESLGPDVAEPIQELPRPATQEGAPEAVDEPPQSEAHDDAPVTAEVVTDPVLDDGDSAPEQTNVRLWTEAQLLHCETWDETLVAMRALKVPELR